MKTFLPTNSPPEYMNTKNERDIDIVIYNINHRERRSNKK
jgi:hypothetical protein